MLLGGNPYKIYSDNAAQTVGTENYFGENRAKIGKYIPSSFTTNPHIKEVFEKQQWNSPGIGNKSNNISEYLTIFACMEVKLTFILLLQKRSPAYLVTTHINLIFKAECSSIRFGIPKRLLSNHTPNARNQQWIWKRILLS